MSIDIRLAFRTGPQRFLVRKINFFLVVVFILIFVAKIEFQFVLLTQFDDGSERPALFAAETLKRAHHTLAQNSFHLLRFKLTSRQYLPD